MNRELKTMNLEEQARKDLEQRLYIILEQASQDRSNPDIDVNLDVVTPDNTWSKASAVSSLETQKATQAKGLLDTIAGILLSCLLF